MSAVEESTTSIFVEDPLPELLPTLDVEARQQNWLRMYGYFEKLQDGNGQLLDVNIIEGVTALNLLGVETTGSCGGHISRLHDPSDHYYDSPHITFMAQVPPELRDKHKALAREEDALEEVVYESEDHDEALDRRHTEVLHERVEMGRKIRSIELQEVRRTIELLEEFYRSRQGEYIPVEQRLIVDKMTIINQGGESLNVIPVDERAEKLKAYQEELEKFSEYLKKKYLQT